MRIPVTKYNFNLEYIDENNFYRLKNMLETNKQSKIDPPHLSISKMFNTDIKIILYTLSVVIFMFLAFYLAESLFQIKIWELLVTLPYLLIFGAFAKAIQLFENISNYKEAIEIKDMYYSKVQDMILRAGNYMSFKNEFSDKHYKNYDEYYSNTIRIQHIMSR